MQGLVLATCDRALGPSGAAPEWVHLFPDGKMTGRDGRSFELADPQGLVLAFQSGGVDLPIDYEHQNDKPEARLSGPVPAAGWIKELKADDSGLWGRVEWTATAREMISRKEYRYLSPSFLFHPKTRQIVRLKGAGLVHNPNLHLTALASQETDMPPETLQTPAPSQKPAPDDLGPALAKLLGLPPEASPKDLLAKLVERLSGEPDPAKFMPVAAVQEMLSTRRAEMAEVNEGRAQEKVRAAVQAGYITRGMQEWALALCRSDEASFDQFLTGVGPTFAHFSQRPNISGQSAPDRFTRAAPSQDDTEAAICAQLGLKPGTLASS